MLVVQSVLLSVGMDLFLYSKNVIERYLYDGKTSDVEETRLIEISSQKTCACTLDEFGLRFWPPLYIQRYMAIQEIIEHPVWNGSIKKITDFGCSEFGLFKFIKLVPGLNNIMLVDVDFNTLDMHQTKIVPTNYDYISMNERKEPMTVDIYHGSIAEHDDRMLGIDAVICIELIEHLYTDVLDALPSNVFGFIKPKVAVFTTPNVEFNTLFPNFTTEFRHDDHKFEWNRKEFQKWAKNITLRYPDYAVQFDGIGVGPRGTEKLGCCTQMAVFYRKDMKTSSVQPIGSTPYKLLRRVDYPFELEDDKTIKEQAVYDKLRTFISEASSNKEFVVGENMEIPLSLIMPHVNDCCSSTDELEYFVSKLYSTEKNEKGEWLLIKCISECSSDEYISDSDSSSNRSGQEYSLLEDSVNNQSEENCSTVGMSFGNSKLCYSTPMNRNQGIHSNNVDSFNTIFSNSDLYKTALDFNKSKDCEDMEISSSCNSSLIVNDCKIYQDFIQGRNNSTTDEDISGTEETLKSIATSHEYFNDNDKANDNTVIQNGSNVSLNNNSSSVNESKTENIDFSNNVIIEEIEIGNQSSVCLNRTLLDESGYTENLLSTPDKEFKD